MSRQLFHSAPYRAGRLLALVLGVVFWLAVAIDLPYTFEAGKIVGDASRDHPRLTEEAAAQLAAAGGTPTGFSAYFTIMILCVYLSFWLVAAILYLRGPRTGMVLITTLWLLSFGLMFPTNLNGLITTFPQWHLFISLIQLLSSVLLGWTFLSFPNGRLNPSLAFRLAAVGSVIVPLTDIAGDFGTARLQTAVNIALAIWLLLVVWIMGYRYFRTFDVTEKLQAKWFFAAVTASVCLLLLGWTADSWLSDLWSEFLLSSTIYLACMAIPVSLGISLFRYRLWDINPIINRAIVYSALTICLLAVYSLVVLYVGSLVGSRNWFSSLMGAGAVSLIFQPLRIRLGRAVNRMMYGKADEPYAVLTGLSRRLGQSYTPKDALQTIVNTIRESFHLPYSAILLVQGGAAGSANEDVVAQSGKITLDVIRKPLSYHGEVCGYLVMAPRAHGETFRPKDERLLEQLAFQAGAVVHAYRLTAELQNSRQKLVITRESERHRIRRDLHDGLGPLLAAQALHVGTVRHIMVGSPEAAKKMLTRMEDELCDAVAEVRRIVYNLRPPSLDDMGLIEAIAELGRKYSSGVGGFLVEFSAPSSLPPLEAAVEVALYRISQESLHNIHRHAKATHVFISLHFANTAELTVEDNGIGLKPANEWQPGVGLYSIRERAEELGGSCLIENRAGGQTGTCVQVTIPIMAAGMRAGEA